MVVPIHTYFVFNFLHLHQKVTNRYTRAQIRFISKNVNVDSSWADLARQFCISESTLNRVMCNVYGDDISLDRRLIGEESGPDLQAALEEEDKMRARRKIPWSWYTAKVSTMNHMYIECNALFMYLFLTGSEEK